MGERRRRREAERAAARAAAEAGSVRPLTRRELRWQQAEEEARLEAIATGELPLGDLRAQVEGSPEASATAPSSATAGTAPSAAAARTGTSASTTAGTAPAVGESPSAVGESPSSDERPALTRESPASPGERPSRTPSRRSLRERAQDATSAPEERPQERTSTGRRPVVRTPSTAQGVRSLDATGQLTGIQPVVRPDAPERPGTAAEEPDVHAGPSDGAEPFVLDLAGAAETARSAPPQDDPAPGVGPQRGTEEADERDDHVFTLRPQWVAISSVSGATPDDAKTPLPSRRSLRSRAEDTAATAAPEVDPDPGRTRNPAVTAMKVAVLVVVAAVIGALIWLLAGEAFGDDEPAGAAPAPMLITAPHPEETSAR